MEPGEALEAGAALVRSANRRERLLLEGAVRLERFARDDLAAFDGDDRSLGQLALAQLDADVALDELERDPRRGEEELALRVAEPERPAQTASQKQLGAAFVEPCRRHRAVKLPQGVGRAAMRRLGEREGDLGVDG